MEEFAGPVQQVAEARIWCQTERCSRSEEVANEADGADVYSHLHLININFSNVSASIRGADRRRYARIGADQRVIGLAYTRRSARSVNAALHNTHRRSGTIFTTAIRRVWSLQQLGQCSQGSSWLPVHVHFYRAARQHTDARYWYRNSVYPSRSGIASKRLDISSQFLHHTVAQSFYIFAKFWRSHPLRGR